MKNYLEIKLNKGEGFTLLEVLIALSIIVVGALAVFALMTRTVDTTARNRRSIIAVNLAREGLEIIRSVRDSSVFGFDALTVGNWLVDSDVANFGTLIAADSNDISSCNNCELYLNGGQYVHNSSGGQATGIKRLVNITDGVDGVNVICEATVPCEKIITVYVLFPGANKPYKLLAHLTDWR